MTEQQKVALTHHCRFAFETIQARFRHAIPGGKASILLTVNSGWE